MYENFFAFQRRPFVSVPDVDLYYPGETTEAARQTLVRCIERGEGPGLLLGPPGSGKTLLCRLLAVHFARRMPVGFLCAGRLGSRVDLLRTILYELGQPYRDLEEGEARIALVDYLTSREDSPPAALLVVDEAHTLPLRLLDELRMLGNLHKGQAPALRLILAGGMVLEEHLANPKLECLSQRITARCYLEPLDGCETAAYIASQVDAVRGPRNRLATELFDEMAARAVYQATDGVPRLVNQVCDHALLLAYNTGKSVISAADVEAAWAELQQLPSPWSDEPAEASAVIEFGSLDDEADEPAGAPREQTEADARPRLQILHESRASEALHQCTSSENAIEPSTVRLASNPFAEVFEVEEVVVPRSAIAHSGCVESEAIAGFVLPAQHGPAHNAPIDVRYSPDDDSRDEVDSAEAVRPARPVCAAFSPGFPLPEFSWPDPQYGYSPLPRTKPIHGPVPGTGHLKRPG